MVGVSRRRPERSGVERRVTAHTRARSGWRRSTRQPAALPGTSREGGCWMHDSSRYRPSGVMLAIQDNGVHQEVQACAEPQPRSFASGSIRQRLSKDRPQGRGRTTVMRWFSPAALLTARGEAGRSWRPLPEVGQPRLGLAVGAGTAVRPRTPAAAAALRSHAAGPPPPAPGPAPTPQGPSAGRSRSTPGGRRSAGRVSASLGRDAQPDPAPCGPGNRWRVRGGKTTGLG